MNSSVSLKDEIWFLRVCHHISTGLCNWRCVTEVPNKQTNTHPSPLLHTQPVRSPAPLSAPQAKIRALHYNSCINISSYLTVNTAHTHYNDPLRETIVIINQSILSVLEQVDCTQWGTAMAQWLRCCATNRKVAGSIPGGVSGFFIDIKSFRSHYGPGVDSASNRNEYQDHFLGVKAAGA